MAILCINYVDSNGGVGAELKLICLVKFLKHKDVDLDIVGSNLDINSELILRMQINSDYI